MAKITIIPGDGIGPEVMAAALSVLDMFQLDLTYDFHQAGAKVLEETGQLVPEAVYESIEKNRVVLKGPITTPIGTGFQSINVALRKKYDLYANIRPILSLENVVTPFKSIDIVIFRENTEGLYIGLETKIDDDTFESIKRTTRNGCTRIVRAAFEYARLHHRKSVTVVHKANIMKLTDGLFLDVSRTIAKEYPEFTLKEMIVDNMCMQLVINPNAFDVIVTENLYGDILSDLCAGLVGGLGVVPGANIGNSMAIFESVHGSAPDIAGKNIANPTALLLSAAMMLDHLGYLNEATLLRRAINSALANKSVVTPDLKGTGNTATYVAEIKKYILSGGEL